MLCQTLLRPDPPEGLKGGNRMQQHVVHFVIYIDHMRQYRWRLRAANGLIIADSGEGYSTHAACRQGIDLVKQYAPSAPVTG